MNYLDSLMGLNQQGIPQDMSLPADPLMQMAMQGDEAGMMSEMGVPMEDPYAMTGMEQPQGGDIGYQMATDMLGGPPPVMGQAEMDAIAQNLGIGSDSRVGPLEGQMYDPMYSQKFNVFDLVGGA